MRALDPSVSQITAGQTEYNRGFIGGLYMRPFPDPSEPGFRKGYIDDNHAHYIDHARFIVCGSVRVDWRLPDGTGGTVVVQGPAFVPIPAGAEHKGTVLEDGTRWYCIFAEAEADKLEDAGLPVPFDASNVKERPYVCK